MDTNYIVDNYFCKRIRKIIQKVPTEIMLVAQEIRLRVGQPICIVSNSREYFVSANGITNIIGEGCKVTKEDIAQTLEVMSEYSIYAFNEEIRKGYLSLQGGVRVGIVGKTVIEGNVVRTVKNISAINIRIAKQIKGVCEGVINYILTNDIKHTLIISPPGCGKTTLLRDIVRTISNIGYNVGLVDERSEIAGTYMGQPQLDVGARTDVLDSCPKAIGMKMLLRSMAPNVIVADEIGSKEDIEAIGDVINSGVKIICTMHGNSLADMRRIKDIASVFERHILLSNRMGVGTVEGIFDEGMKNIW